MLHSIMFKKYTSPNFNDRKDGKTAKYIVLHYTGMEDAKSALTRLCDPDAQVSAHYLIADNGKTHGLVADDKRAWHAGVSYWRGETDLNSASIGVEITNPGHELGYGEFPNAQILALVKLCKGLIKWYNIPAGNVIGHSDIAVSRKIDPGHLFPWQRLAGAGIGLWPKPEEMDYQSAEDIILNDAQIREQFTAFGYSPDAPLNEVITAFHRHFAPERFDTWQSTPDRADIKTIASLLALSRQRFDAGAV